MENQRKEALLNLFIAQRLRQHRERKGLTQIGLAQQLDLSVAAIRNAELGLERLSATDLYLACQSLGISLRSFFRDYDQFEQEMSDLDGSLDLLNQATVGRA